MEETVPFHTFRVRITGRVQGVGYRAWACDTARSLGVSGWVRNEADGSVSALAHGPAPRIAEFIVLLESGPRGARVEDVGKEDADAPEGLRGFRIVW